MIGRRIQDATIVGAHRVQLRTQRPGRTFVVLLDCGPEAAQRWATGEYVEGDEHWTAGAYFDAEAEALLDLVDRVLGPEARSWLASDGCAACAAEDRALDDLAVSRCSDCGEPAHASETDDSDRCATCAAAAGEPHAEVVS